MRIRRKLIAILLIITIITSFMPNLISYAAEPSFTLSVDGVASGTKSAQVNDEISVGVNLTDGLESQKTLVVEVKYDPTKLEIIPDAVNGEEVQLLAGSGYSLNSDIAPGHTVAMGLVSDGVVTITFNTPVAIAQSGTVGTLKFKVLEEGSSTVSFNKIVYDLDDNSENSETEVSSASYVTVSCGPAMTGLTLTPPTATINKGKTYTLSATKEPVNTGNSEPIKWVSSDTSVATVSDGVVTAVGAGTATIIATCAGYEASSVITVKSPLTGLTVSHKDVKMLKGDTLQVTADKVPEDTTSTAVITWVSNDYSVVSVDHNGLLTAVGSGTTQVRVSCGTYTERINVTVEAPLKGITIDKSEIDIDIDQTEQLTLVKDPIDTTDTNPTVWTSSNPEIATVDENGLVTGKAHGTTTITVTVGTFTATTDVIVSAHLQSIEIKNDKIVNKTMELFKGQTEVLSVDFFPEVFTESRTIIWRSSKPEVVAVHNGTISAITPGTAEIVATSVNGKTDTIKVTVPEIKASTLIVNKTSLILDKGQTDQLVAVIEPENTTDDKSIAWISSDPKIVKVDETGKITALSVGSATITATAAGLTATTLVEVTCELSSISLNITEMTLELGETSTDTLIVTKNPIDATVDEINNTTWVSLNESVATVENGVVTAVGSGTAIIQAKLAGKVATCTVNVGVTLTGVEIENNEEELVLKVGQQSTLGLIYTPANATNIPKGLWKSSSQSIVSVNQKGTVTAISEGEATITVNLGNGLTATRKVRVTPLYADSITINQQVETLLKGEEIQLEAVLEPASAIDKITWETSDEKIATISKKGLLKGVKAGTVTITVKGQDGQEYSMEIEVKEVELESINTTLEEETVLEGDKVQLTVEYNPEDATDDVTLTYETSNESMATIDSYGKVTAKKAGTVIITTTVIAVNGDGEEREFVSQVELVIEENPDKEEPEEDEEDTNTTNTNNTTNTTNTTEDNTVVEDTTTTTNTTNTVETTNTTNVVNTTNKPTSSGGNKTNSSTVEGLVTSPHTGDMNVGALVSMMLISLAGMFTRFKSIEYTLNQD